MKREQEWELQAYLDGELSARAARRVAGWLAREPEAQALAGELRMTKSVLAGNEPEVAVPESREFYWSKIQRAIEAAERAPDRRRVDWRELPWWRKLWLPASGLALVAVLLLILGKDPRMGSEFYLTEVENLSEHFTAHAFRSHKDQVLFVWISAQHQTPVSDDLYDMYDLYPMDEEDDIVVQ
jgi:hypothetical protein